MNRPIRFRAWDGQRMLTSKYFGVSFTGEFYAAQKMDEWNPADYTLMQFTGLHDKNGKEIYEGDVVRRVTSANGGHEYRTVEWHVSTRRVGWNVGLVDTWEVIGNIYENPDLMTNA